MTALDRYLLSRLLRASGLIVCLLCGLVISLDLLLRLGELNEGQLSSDQSRLALLLQLALMRVPQVLSPLLPVALVGAMIMVSAPMLRRGEFTALVASGLSLKRCMRSVLILALGFGSADVLLSDQIIPRLETPLRAIDDTLSGDAQRGQTWLVEETGSAWYVDRIYLRVGDHPELRGVIVATTDGRFVQANQLVFENQQWVLRGQVSTVEQPHPNSANINTASDTPNRRTTSPTLSGAPQLRTLDKLVCTGSLDLPYPPETLAVTLASRYALTSAQLWQRRDRLHDALIWQRLLRAITPLAALLLAVPVMVSFTNRGHLLTAAIKSLAVATLPFAIQGLGNVVAETSTAPLSVIIPITGGITLLPGIVMWWRWPD